MGADVMATGRPLLGGYVGGPIFVSIFVMIVALIAVGESKLTPKAKVWLWLALLVCVPLLTAAISFVMYRVAWVDYRRGR